MEVARSIATGAASGVLIQPEAASGGVSAAGASQISFTVTHRCEAAAGALPLASTSACVEHPAASATAPRSAVARSQRASTDRYGVTERFMRRTCTGTVNQATQHSVKCGAVRPFERKAASGFCKD